MKNISFLTENFQFLEVKFSIYLNRRVFVMKNRIIRSQERHNLIGVSTATALKESKGPDEKKATTQDDLNLCISHMVKAPCQNVLMYGHVRTARAKIKPRIRAI